MRTLHNFEVDVWSSYMWISKLCSDAIRKGKELEKNVKNQVDNVSIAVTVSTAMTV